MKERLGKEREGKKKEVEICLNCTLMYDCFEIILSYINSNLFIIIYSTTQLFHRKSGMDPLGDTVGAGGCNPLRTTPRSGCNPLGNTKMLENLLFSKKIACGGPFEQF